MTSEQQSQLGEFYQQTHTLDDPDEFLAKVTALQQQTDSLSPFYHALQVILDDALKGQQIRRQQKKPQSGKSIANEEVLASIGPIIFAQAAQVSTPQDNTLYL
jgi:hypothetical protein